MATWLTIFVQGVPNYNALHMLVLYHVPEGLHEANLVVLGSFDESSTSLHQDSLVSLSQLQLFAAKRYAGVFAAYIEPHDASLLIKPFNLSKFRP